MALTLMGLHSWTLLDSLVLVLGMPSVRAFGSGPMGFIVLYTLPLEHVAMYHMRCL